MVTLTAKDIVLSDKDFERISELVYKHCRINLHTGKKELVRARLAKRIRQGKFNNFSEYIDYVLEELPKVVDKLRKMSPLYNKK